MTQSQRIWNGVALGAVLLALATGGWLGWTLMAADEPAPVPLDPLPEALFDTRPVDRAALSALLDAGEFEALETQLRRLEADTARDPAQEQRLVIAYSVFQDSNEALTAPLQAWRAARPQSGIAAVAQGVHLAARGWAARGTGWNRETTRQQFGGMEARFEEARRALLDARKHAPGMLMPAVALLNMSQSGGARDCHRLGRPLLQQFPLSYELRLRSLYCFQPRWGGSYELMARFAADQQADVGRNPRLRVLLGYVDFARGRDLQETGDWAAVARAADEALEYGLDRNFLSDRFRGHAYSGQWEQAIADGEAFTRLFPEDPDSAPEEVRQRLSGALQHVLKAGLAEQALRGGDLLLQRWPEEGNFHFARAQALETLGRKAEAFSAYEQVTRLHPDHYDSFVGIDRSLAAERRWDEIISAWTRYLATVPGDGRAYLERGGARHHRGQDEAAARADVDRACELRAAGACELRARLIARAG